MIETSQPRAPELWATQSVRELVPLLEQGVTLRLENAALRAENAILQERIRELEAGRPTAVSAPGSIRGLNGYNRGMGAATLRSSPLSSLIPAPPGTERLPDPSTLRLQAVTDS